MPNVTIPNRAKHETGEKKTALFGGMYGWSWLKRLGHGMIMIVMAVNLSMFVGKKSPFPE